MKNKFLIILSCVLFAFGCGNKYKTETKADASNEDLLVKNLKADKLEEGECYHSQNGIDVFCLYSSNYSADLETTDWLSEDEIKTFAKETSVLNGKTLRFRYKELNIPVYASFLNGKVTYDESIPQSFEKAKVYQLELEQKMQKEQAEKDRLAIKEKEENFRHDEKNFTDYLNSIRVGTTMKDFNQAVYQLSDSKNEYTILYSRYGESALKLKKRLVNKQEQVFPLIRKRYVSYFKDAFRALGRGDIKFVLSGTVLNLLSDEFYDQASRDGVYESMCKDMANYRFTRLVVKSSNGQLIKDYYIGSQGDYEL